MSECISERNSKKSVLSDTTFHIKSFSNPQILVGSNTEHPSLRSCAASPPTWEGVVDARPPLPPPRPLRLRGGSVLLSGPLRVRRLAEGRPLCTGPAAEVHRPRSSATHSQADTGVHDTRLQDTSRTCHSASILSRIGQHLDKVPGATGHRWVRFHYPHPL